MLHVCTPVCRHSPGLQRARGSNFTIDFHCHVLTPAAESLVAQRPEKRTEKAAQSRAMSQDSIAHNTEVMLPQAQRRLCSIEERLHDMAAMGVDLQVLSPSPTQYYYWADERLAEQLCRVQNEHIAALCAEHPDRLRGLGNVALQHPGLAVEQLEHAVRKLGLQGVEVSSVAAQTELSDPVLEPFWATAARLGCTVFLHPLGTTLGERTAPHYLSNIIGQPLETTIALSRLIFGGTFERHPGVRIVAAHGGGYLPSYLGRSSHGAQVRPEAARSIPHPPLHYLRHNVWFDTVVHDPRILRHLMDTVGVERLVVGTDYPFDMGDYDVHDLVAAVPDITPQERALVLGLNAAALLGIDASQAARARPGPAARAKAVSAAPPEVTFLVNGQSAQVVAGDETLLVDYLRDTLKLKGTRFGCGEEQCGACVVQIDGRPACACQIETGHLQGKSVWTVEALAGDAHGVQLLAAFERHQAAQCGFCTSGILMRAQALLRETPLPTREAVMAALAPHLCRCGAQPRIIDAVMDATPSREAP